MAKLTAKQRKILAALAENGAMTALEVSVKTLIVPDETLAHVKALAGKGYIEVHRLRSGPEREALTLSEKGRSAVR
ncbi:MAG: winged helix-turn-helix transcriptional regulator [Chloroflexota bacterium]|nr:winged helix-turn-helix transcriptional regulator [Chloroflexota bacterium]